MEKIKCKECGKEYECNIGSPAFKLGKCAICYTDLTNDLFILKGMVTEIENKILKEQMIERVSIITEKLSKDMSREEARKIVNPKPKMPNYSQEIKDLEGFKEFFERVIGAKVLIPKKEEDFLDKIETKIKAKITEDEIKMPKEIQEAKEFFDKMIGKKGRMIKVPKDEVEKLLNGGLVEDMIKDLTEGCDCDGCKGFKEFLEKEKPKTQEKTKTTPKAKIVHYKVQLNGKSRYACNTAVSNIAPNKLTDNAKDVTCSNCLRWLKAK